MSYGRIVDERSRNEVAEILSAAFASPMADVQTWVARAGVDEFRRLSGEQGQTVATLLRVPMGLWLGGRRLTNLGVAGVGVRPNERGQGSAGQIMSEALKEARGEGFVVSTLYPATQVLYRRVGYELAGAHCEVKVALKDLPRGPRTIALRIFEPADRPEVVNLGDQQARMHNGTLARGPYVWSRIFDVRGEISRGVLAFQGNELVGYLFYLQKSRPDLGGLFDMVLTDFVATSRGSAERLFTFLADHRSTGNELIWKTGPSDPLIHALPERIFRLELKEYWMLRVLDVPRALAERGYPSDLQTRLEISIDDPLFEENRGPFVLEVSGGEAKVERGGQGRLKLTIQDLAALYTGHQSPAALQLLGGLSGDEESVRRASALFAGPAPFMYEFF